MTHKDIAHHLRQETKRIDLPPDVIRTMAEAYAEIMRLEKRIFDFQEGFEGGCYLCEPVGEMNRQLREERDEARRLYCSEKAAEPTTSWSKKHYAEYEGWDCYDK